MNFLNKNILLCLVLAIPFAHAGQTNHRPWYTRLFGGYSAAIVGTAVVTSLGWWYFGVKPARKENIHLQTICNALKKDLENISDSIEIIKTKKERDLCANKTKLKTIKTTRLELSTKKEFTNAGLSSQNVSSQKRADRVENANKAIDNLTFQEIEINMDNVILETELRSISNIQEKIATKNQESL